MKTIHFDSKNARVPHTQLKRLQKKLAPEITRMRNDHGYHTQYASLSCPSDIEVLRRVKRVAREKKALKPSLLVVCGIGGSNLGAMAVQKALQGKLYNQLDPELRVLFLETVDSTETAAVCDLVRKTLKKKQRVILNVISKSGGTTEAIANFQVLVHLLKKHQKEYQKYIVITTDEQSTLWNVAQSEGFSYLPVPANVGGRYSVFSAVGLFPLALLGLNVQALVQGAQNMIRTSLRGYTNAAATSAAIQYYHARHGRAMSDMFLFGVDLEYVGRWYRQLMGESLGKEHTIHGKRVWCGITPLVSVGSTDLHSMAQLYLGGPQDKYTTFVRVDKPQKKVTVPQMAAYRHLVDHVQGKSYAQIMDAILTGVQRAYVKGKRPFTEIVLPRVTPYALGALLQMKMIEMMLLGYLFDVNPFDQPHVELYKKETRALLKC